MTYPHYANADAKKKYIGQVVRVLVQGQTDTQTYPENGPKTEDLRKFFFQFLSLFVYWRSNNPPKNPRPLINFLGQITLAAHPLRGSYFRLEQFSAV